MSIAYFDALPLRERKKAMSRAAILSASQTLFAERGYDNVTVAEIADAANISVKTLFVYFRSKEDLVGLNTSPLDGALTALRRRSSDVTPAVAVAGSLIEALNSGSDQLELLGVDESPALRNVILRLWASYEDRITELLAAEDGVTATPEHRMLALQLVAICRLATTPEVRSALRGVGRRQSAVLLEGWLRDAAAAVDGFYE